MTITAAGVCCDADACSRITDTCLLARIQAYRIGLSFDINKGRKQNHTAFIDAAVHTRVTTRHACSDTCLYQDLLLNLSPTHQTSNGSLHRVPV